MTTPIQNRSIIRLSQAIKKAQTQICELVPFLTKIPIFYGNPSTPSTIKSPNPKLPPLRSEACSSVERC